MMRCKCGILLDKPWMVRAHRCPYTESAISNRRFFKWFLITEGILVTFTIITYLLKI